MRLGVIATAIFALALTTGVASADVITTYTLSGFGTLDGATVAGSFQIDQTTYNASTNAGFVGGTITVSGDNNGDMNGTYHFFDFNVNSNSAVFENSFFSLLPITIGNPPITNGSLSEAGQITDLNFLRDIIDQGTVTAASVTTVDVPEPTSLVLLGTALAGLGLIRRRRRNA